MYTVLGVMECTGLPPSVKTTAIETEKKRKHPLSCAQTTRISQIKNALGEVIFTTDPKEAETHQILEHLTAAHHAMEMACSLLRGNGQSQTALKISPKPKHRVTIVERSILFHQWQARRSDPTCPTSNTRSSCQTPARQQR